jgi:hypothetical protein
VYGPAFYLFRAITAFENATTSNFTFLLTNLASLGRDYCLIVDTFEKNYSVKDPSVVREDAMRRRELPRIRAKE